VDGFKSIVDNIQKKMAALSFNQKVLLGAVAVTSIISMAVFSMWLQQEEMAVLFTNLSPEDASAALAEITKQDIKSELSNGGTTIMVPETEVNRLRMDLQSQGVVTGGTVGFDIFDGPQYGMTEFTQNVNFKRALEGELTESIKSLHGIQSARVHLVLPKPSIFKKIDTGATASVVVRLGRGAALAHSQVAGIQRLVAGSVENMEVDAVTVIDQQGKVLSSAIQDDESGRTESQLTMRKEVESYLTHKAESMLDQVLGMGKAIVRVDATLNFEKIDKEREIFDPQTVVRSEERDESQEGAGGGTQEKSITNYEINRTVEHIVGEVGGIKNLSVAVFVDGNYEPGADGNAPVYNPRTEDELGQLRRIVQTAVGLSAVRGDQIEVVNMQFQTQPLEDGTGFTPDWVGIVTQYGGKVVLIIMLGVLVMTLRKNIGQAVAEVFTPTTVKAGKAGKSLDEDSEEMPESFDGIPELNDKVINDIQEYASENPERVAEVIQSWIHNIDLGPKKAKAAVGD
jgi:flagellar M-ring protein FliF